MKRYLIVLNSIDALSANRRLPKDSIRSSIVAESFLSSCGKCSNVTLKAVAYAVSLEQPDWHTKPSSVLSVQPAKKWKQTVRVPMSCGRAKKKKKQRVAGELEQGDCRITQSLANGSELILTECIGKHTNTLIDELIISTEGKTGCKKWNTDNWGGYERLLPPYIEHNIGKNINKQLERTNSIIRQ